MLCNTTYDWLCLNICSTHAQNCTCIQKFLATHEAKERKPKQAEILQRKIPSISIPKAKWIQFDLLKCMSNYYKQKNQSAHANLHLRLNMT
jgi:hypothetical protein